MGSAPVERGEFSVCDKQHDISREEEICAAFRPMQPPPWAW